MALTCQQPGPAKAYTPGDFGGALRSFLERFGAERCGKPAVYRDQVGGRPTCEDCADEMKRAHAEGKTLLSMLAPGTKLRFTPIQ